MERRDSHDLLEQINKEEKKKKSEKILSGIFLGSITGASILFGFGLTLAIAKKKEPTLFLKGIIRSPDIPESGGSLALRALGWGTLYATTGFSLFCYAVWKALGVQNLHEFRQKVGSMLPRITNPESQGRTEFENLRDLINYIIEEDKEKKT
ncbi:transmembrane protein 242-like [Centruroides sculpturatus]|uniref:transmembrane protein 242-like n=1 Tax=Centruroides sculpturatus TaxID=218467 RepID=UPI000C6CEBCE|nr:transmembrane protein 242-like [Centruroides sculpturatus]